ncbi:hypothetical protein MTO96_036201 [Rhipicephalus appendiculatus]
MSVIEPWLSGLKTNRTLERLTVDLSLYTPYECSLFIDAIAVNVSIATVTVRNIADNGCLQAVYAIIRDREIQQRVVIEDHHVGLKDVQELWLYPEASAITLSSLHFPEPTVLCTAIRVLSACRHVTSLRLRFRSYEEALYIAAADYIAAVSTLNDIELYLNGLCEERGENRVPGVHRLIEALASNRNLHKLKVHVEHLNATCCKLMADSILQNPMLYELSLEALSRKSCSSFLWCLVRGLADNYSLLVARLPDFSVALDTDMITLHGITRRNSRLIDLASRFVTRDHRDSATKRALSLVYEHPKLLETVAKKAGVTKIKAKSLIKDSMPLPSFSEMESLMSAVSLCVTGCIDCTHVPIVSPGGENAEVFRNRKGYFSFNVQAITGPELQFFDVVASWPGSVHDSRIFTNSRVMALYEQKAVPGVLLGDQGIKASLEFYVECVLQQRQPASADIPHT